MAVIEGSRTGPARTRRVPVADLCSLWAETATTPMNIALIGTVEAGALTDDAGQPRLSEIRAFIERRLDRAEPLRWILHATRWGQGLPVWVDAPRFNVADHVLVVEPERPLDGEQEFLTWCAHRSLLPLDRSRPLWRMDLIPRLPGGRMGVLVVVHHVVADGLRGVDLVATLLQRADETAGPPPPWQPSRQPRATNLVTDNVRGRLGGLRGPAPGSIRHALASLDELRVEWGTRAPHTALGGPIGRRRRLDVVRRDVEELRWTGHRLGCTINDLLLAAVTQGLREMLLLDGQLVEGLVLRASAPVGAVASRPGGMMVVPLPVGIVDPAERLRLIAADTAGRKRHAAEGIAHVASMPATLARLGVTWARRAAATHINLYVTNVPGPRVPLLLAGARLEDVAPLAPLVPGVRLSVTALSYDGVLSIALLADEAVPGLGAIRDGIESAFDTYSGGLVRAVPPDIDPRRRGR